MRAINGSTVSGGRIVRLRMPKSWIARAQVVEYLRSFLIGRTGWASLGTLLLISGAFGVYRRDIVIEAGGLDPDSIGEDFELCLRVHKMMRDRVVSTGSSSCPSRSAGPRCRARVPCCAGSAAGGTVGCGRPWWPTAGCCSAAGTGGSAGSGCRTTGSSSSRHHSSRPAGWCWCHSAWRSASSTCSTRCCCSWSPTATRSSSPWQRCAPRSGPSTATTGGATSASPSPPPSSRTSATGR